MAITLIISSLIVRAGRANAFVSSAVPFLQQIEYRVDVQTGLPWAFQWAPLQAMRESTELGQNIQATPLLKSPSPAARDTRGGDGALWAGGEPAARKHGGGRGTGADSAHGCLYSNSSTVGQVEACVQDRRKWE